MSATAPTFKKGQAWLVTIISILCSLVVAMVTFKAISTAPLMMQYFGVGIAEYGSVTGIVGALAIVGAIPSGIALAKMGPRRLMILIMVISIISTFLQIIMINAGASFVAFMAVGGLGAFVYGMWTVNGPMLVTAWFPAEKRGLPNSISTAWVSVAMMIILLVSTPLFMIAGIDPSTGTVNPYGFIYVWWMIAILLIISLILCLIFVRMPKPENSFLEAAPQAEGQKKAKFSDGLKLPAVWMLIIMFLVYGFITAAYGNYYPTYLNSPVEQSGLGMDLGSANLLSSVTTYVMLAMNFIWGFVLNKIPNKGYGVLNLVISILTGLVGIAMFNMPNVGIVAPYLIIYGIVSQMYPPVCFAMLPEVVDSPEQLSAGMGVLAIFSNLAGVMATILVGIVQGAFGTWQSLTLLMVIFTIATIVAALVFMGIYRKKFAQKHAELA